MAKKTMKIRKHKEPFLGSIRGKPITPRTKIVKGNKINSEYEGKEEIAIA